MKKVVKTDLVVLWITLGALICAAIALNSSLDRLVSKDQE